VVDRLVAANAFGAGGPEAPRRLKCLAGGERFAHPASGIAQPSGKGKGERGADLLPRS